MPVFVILCAFAAPWLCGLFAWIAWLRFCRHVFDVAGPSGLGRVPQVARAFGHSSGSRKSPRRPEKGDQLRERFSQDVARKDEIAEQMGKALG